MLGPFTQPVACCCVLLGVVTQSLERVKLLNQQLPTFRLFRGHRSIAQQFLACNHVTRRPCWWRVSGQYNIIFSRRIYIKMRFSSQRRKMLLFFTLTHHQHSRRDVTYKPALESRLQQTAICAT